MSRPTRAAHDLRTLRDAMRPFRLHYFPRLRSTNDHAAALRKRGELFAPAAVLTFCQTAGRGRGANSWWSGDGCITVTFVLAVDECLSPTQVPLAAGLAVRNALAEVADRPDIRLKWPNDVVHDGRKLAGVLCERVNGVDLIGVGANVNANVNDAPGDLRPKITSLLAMTGRTLEMAEVLGAISRNLLEVFSRRRARPFPSLVREFDAHHEIVGRQIAVRISTDGPTLGGICEGLDDAGRLLLRCGKQQHRLVSGHVEVR